MHSRNCHKAQRIRRKSLKNWAKACFSRKLISPTKKANAKTLRSPENGQG
jgi:hypothetical protein